MEAIKRLFKRLILIWRLAVVPARAAPHVPFLDLVSFVLRKRVGPAHGVMDYPDGKIIMQVDTNADLMRLSSSSKESETVRWISDNLRPGDVFFDIGANVGAYALIAAAREPKASVYAFEPSFSTFATLSRNILTNQCSDRVVPLQVALGRAEQFLYLSFSSTESGAALHQWSKHTERGSIAVPMFSLDHLVSIGLVPQPTLMKIDVDGGEEDVLGGARSTLGNRALRTVLIEVDADRSEQTKRMLVEAGFYLAASFPRGKGSERTRFINCVFVRS